MMKFFIAAVLLFCVSSANATITRTNQNTVSIANGGTVTITSSTSGNALVVVIGWQTNLNTITSITDGGDTFVQATGAAAVDNGDAGATDIWYCLNGAGGKTSVVVNENATGTMKVGVYEYHSTLGVLLFGTASKTDNGVHSATPLGPSVTTTGTSVVVGIMNEPQSALTGTVANGGDTFTSISTLAGMCFADLMNLSAAAHQPGYTLTPNPDNAGAFASSTASFKEPSAASSKTQVGAFVVGP